MWAPCTRAGGTGSLGLGVWLQGGETLAACLARAQPAGESRAPPPSVHEPASFNGLRKDFKVCL